MTVRITKEAIAKDYYSICRDFYRMINEEVFSGVLPDADFAINRRAQVALGSVDMLSSSPTIRLAPIVFNNPIELENTIAHEMVHIWQGYAYRKNHDEKMLDRDHPDFHGVRNGRKFFKYHGETFHSVGKMINDQYPWLNEITVTSDSPGKMKSADPTYIAEIRIERDKLDGAFIVTSKESLNEERLAKLALQFAARTKYTIESINVVQTNNFGAAGMPKTIKGGGLGKGKRFKYYKVDEIKKSGNSWYTCESTEPVIDLPADKVKALMSKFAPTCFLSVAMHKSKDHDFALAFVLNKEELDKFDIAKVQYMNDIQIDADIEPPRKMLLKTNESEVMGLVSMDDDFVSPSGKISKNAIGKMVVHEEDRVKRLNEIMGLAQGRYFYEDQMSLALCEEMADELNNSEPYTSIKTPDPAPLEEPVAEPEKVEVKQVSEPRKVMNIKTDQLDMF